MILYDAFEEENQDIQHKLDSKPVQKKKGKAIVVTGFEDLSKSCISPIEKLMDEFDGTVKDFRGLFKVQKINFPFANIHQQICNTIKPNSTQRVVNVTY